MIDMQVHFGHKREKLHGLLLNEFSTGRASKYIYQIVKVLATIYNFYLIMTENHTFGLLHLRPVICQYYNCDRKL